MPISLPDVDLTGKVVNNTGKILLSTVGISAGGVSAHPQFIDKPPSIFFHNDSGATLRMVFKDSGQSFTLPAGAWIPHLIRPGESEIDWTILNVLPSPPISLLTMDYYFPGEPVPQTSTLGNSPVGIGGSVSTASNTLSNETASLGTKIIDLGTPSNADIFDVFNDHFLWYVEQATVKHQVLKGQTSGNPLQLGQAGDITEVLGKLLIDQIATTGPVSPPTGSGTVSILQLNIGTLKLALCSMAALKNTSASQFTAAMPTAFTSHAAIFCTEISNTEFLASGVAQSGEAITALTAGSSSSQTAETVFWQWNLGSIEHGFDTLRFQASNANPHSGVIIMIGE